jgi:hypothetical protein
MDVSENEKSLLPLTGIKPLSVGCIERIVVTVLTTIFLLFHPLKFIPVIAPKRRSNACSMIHDYFVCPIDFRANGAQLLIQIYFLIQTAALFFFFCFTENKLKQ